MFVTPRDYQRAALDAVISELKTRVSTLADMATGTGKTFFFAWLAMLLGGRVLVLVHRDELKRQAVDKINRVCPELGVSVEQGGSRGDRRVDRDLFSDQASAIVVASKDTLRRANRLKRYRPDDFDWIVIDEAHRAVRKNESYYGIIRHFCRAPFGTGRAKLIGVTASLDRLDGEALGGLFQSVAFRYTLPEAINDGYLLEPRVKRVHLKGVKLVGLPTARNADGEIELTHTALDRIMRQREYAYGVAMPLLELAGAHKQGVVFCSSAAQAKIQANVLNAEKPGSSALCLGEPYQSAGERRNAQDRLRARDVQFLVTCDVLTEGWDYDGVEFVVLKPSKSRKNVAQMAGRGTRPLDGCVDVWHTPALRKLAIANSPKPYCTLIDPCGASEEHSLVNITDIFKGRYSAALSKPKPEQKPRTRPDDLEERRAMLNALEAIEEERLGGMKVSVEYEMLDGDMLGDPSRKAGSVSRALLGTPASERQCRWLESRGFRVPAGMTKQQASDAIGEIKAREDAGPATIAQRQLLLRLGLNCSVTKGEASVMLNAALAVDRGGEASGEATAND